MYVLGCLNFTVCRIRYYTVSLMMVESGVPSPAGSAELIGITQMEQLSPAGCSAVVVIIRAHSMVVSSAELRVLISSTRSLPLLTHCCAQRGGRRSERHDRSFCGILLGLVAASAPIASAAARELRRHAGTAPRWCAGSQIGRPHGLQLAGFQKGFLPLPVLGVEP